MHFESIKISKQIEISLRWLVFLAQAQKKNKMAYVSLRFFCNKEKLSYYTLQKINQTLVNQKIVESFRGKNGGYRLKKSPLKISLLEIIKAIEGPINFVDCSSLNCDVSHCQLKNIWGNFDKDLTKKLSRVKLAQFI